MSVFRTVITSIIVVFCITLQTVAKISYAENYNAPKQLKYTFTYFNKNDKSTLNVLLEFTGRQEKETIIELPSQYGGINELYKNITDIQVIGATIEKTNTPALLTLYHAPSSKIILSYNVRQSWDGPLSNFDNFLAPIFQKNYFQFIGNGILIYPQSYKNESSNLKWVFDWNVPNGWKVANSYGTNNLHQEFFASFNDVINSLFLSGKFTLSQTHIVGGDVWSAIRGKWPFQEEVFNKIVANIINNEREFWNDNDSPHYLISLIPIKTNKTGMVGTGLTNGFATALKSNYFPNYPMWSVISHEAFHQWNSPDIFDVTDKGNQVYYYWFTEGFTDYYADLLNLRIGLILLPDYIKEYNEMLVNYFSSPAKASTIEEVKENFWGNFAVEKLPYQQGKILAHNWNAFIKNKTNNQQSLDNLMRDIVLFSKEHSKLNLEKMNDIASKYRKENLIDDIHHIYFGDPVNPDEHSLGPCVYQITKMLAPYNPGFDVYTSKEKHVITSVDLNGKAFSAGLRDKQILISIEEHPDDISKKIRITVKEEQAIKIITYYPYQEKLLPIKQFVLDKSKWETNPDECLAWFK